MNLFTMKMVNKMEDIDANVKECIDSINTLIKHYNKGDPVMKNFIATNIFEFLVGLIADEEIKQEIIDAFMRVE